MNIFDLRKFDNKESSIFKLCKECGGKSVIGIEFHDNFYPICGTCIMKAHKLIFGEKEEK